MKGIVDLHIHSNTKGSDGVFSPEELIRYITNYIKEKGIQPCDTIISLTDHNTIDGLEVMQKLSSESRLRFIPGCEIMAYDSLLDLNFEILGYGRIEQLSDKEVTSVLNRIKKGLETRITEQIEKWHRNGIKFSDAELIISDNEYQQLIQIPDKFNDGSIFWPMLKKKVEETTNKRFSIKELNKLFYKIFRDKGGELYVPYPSENFPKPEELISLLSDKGITSILAHPGEYNIREDQRDLLIYRLIDYGLNGLEVYTRKNNDEQIKRYPILAKKNKLVITGGSDFHMDTPEYRLGTYREDKFIPMEVGERLYERVN